MRRGRAPQQAAARRGRDGEDIRGWNYYRTGLEVFAIVMAPLVAIFVERLAPAGVVLVTLATIGLILVFRLVPDSDTAAWPRLPAPERGGRRAEIYRLSWQLVGDRDAAPAVAGHLRETVTHLRAAAPPEDHAALDALAARLANHPDRATLDAVLGEIEAYTARRGTENLFPAGPVPAKTPAVLSPPTRSAP